MSRICHGSTEPQDWVQHSSQANQIYVDVDTTHCNFKGTPHYVCSLVGLSHHWSTTGGSSIYLTATGFRINLRNAVSTYRDGKCDYGELKVQTARDHQWRINWIAVDSCDDITATSG